MKLLLVSIRTTRSIWRCAGRFGLWVSVEEAPPSRRVRAGEGVAGTVVAQSERGALDDVDTLIR
jgi:hypothetical protein